VVTSEQLMKAGGIDRRTLTQLQQLGAIPEPIKRAVPVGRGLRAYWPDSALATMGDVQRLRHEGRSIPEIAKQLKRAVEWGDASVLARQLLAVLDRTITVEVPTTAAGGTIMVAGAGAGTKTITTTGRDYLRGHLTDTLELSFSIGRKTAEHFALLATSNDNLGWALALLQYRTAPVLVACPDDRVYVTTDFLVSHEFSALRAYARIRTDPTEDPPVEPDMLGAALGGILIPLTYLLLDVLKRCGASMNFPVQYSAGEKVNRLEGDAVVEVDYQVVQLPPGSGRGGLYAFTLGSAGRVVRGYGVPKVVASKRKSRAKK